MSRARPRKWGLSQPAMSHMLGRLRDILGDDLLVRGPAGMALTSRGEDWRPGRPRR